MPPFAFVLVVVSLVAALGQPLVADVGRQQDDAEIAAEKRPAKDQETTAPEPLIVTSDLRLEPGALLERPLVVRGSGLVIDGRGATLRGPGIAGRPDSFVGVGLTIEPGRTVTVRNLRIAGFALGLLARHADGLLLEDVDASDNQTDPDAGWNDERRAGGFHLAETSGAVVRRCAARGCWNGIDLWACRDAVIESCDFSRCSNTAARLRLSSRNVLRENDLSHGIRVAKDEAHARDSCGLLVESGSDDNLFLRNDVTHGGNGIFVRISSGWNSTGNRFVENDCSYAHNHGVECWSPGNVFIRNRCNHGSYGFWLGGSDGAVLIGNEASFNGREDGNHNAPIPGIGHGGIVFVQGAAQHLLIEGNHCHDNGGPGIVVRGHRNDAGVDWPFFHVLIQRNRLERNQRALWLEHGSFVELRGNVSRDNADADHVVDVDGLVSTTATPSAAATPRAAIDGPTRAHVGQEVRFGAHRGRDPLGAALQHRWSTPTGLHSGAVATLSLALAGRHRVALFSTNGAYSDLAWSDVLTVPAFGSELGTENRAAAWEFVMGDDPKGIGRVAFADDPLAVEGTTSLRLRVDPYTGRDVAAVFPFADRPLDLSEHTHATFWIRFRNPNFWGFQGPNPVLRLLTHDGYFTYFPTTAKGPRNALWELPLPEGRGDWTRFEIPLAGGDGWTREKTGTIDLSRILSLSLQFDSWGGEPFTIWIDGLRFE